MGKTTFAQRCMELPDAADQTLCQGDKCPYRRKCVRYMYHVKKRLTAQKGASFYMICNPKNYELCYWPYEELKKQIEQNVQV